MNNAFAPVLAALLALSTAFVPGPAAAQATTPAELLTGYQRQAGVAASAARGQAFFTSRHGGDWTAIAFYNTATRSEQIVLKKGHVDPARPTLVRMHALDIFDDIFGVQRGEACPRCGGHQLQPTGGLELRVLDMRVSDD